MLPGPESTTKMSPLGAWARLRGRLKPPDAKSVALKPDGSVSDAPSGRGTTLGGFGFCSDGVARSLAENV